MGAVGASAQLLGAVPVVVVVVVAVSPLLHGIAAPTKMENISPVAKVPRC